MAAALRNLEQQHDELNAAFASGKINGSQFENYSRKIQETRRELIGAHTHSVAIGSHGHTITVNAAGNAENTVKNIAFNYIVRLA
ncbi:hypothetical protein F9470_08880 [Escherichia coli]|nr:hypothetical protein [Escherichia coli]EEY9627233.1 hypothetical protein [Escherichia coli]EFH3740784.1 hypothetical protein [Escherichia coli]EFH8607534.1 hypothetical protein [Escherichia coli]EFK2861986.1 hypothetical protein [Escherichia coli]